jgi:hypothetical protein
MDITSLTVESSFIAMGEVKGLSVMFGIPFKTAQEAKDKLKERVDISTGFVEIKLSKDELKRLGEFRAGKEAKRKKKGERTK